MRVAFAIVVASVAGLWAAPAALAAYGVTNFSATPADSNAGANSDFKISYDFQEPSHQLKDVLIHLPPGLVGNPLATTTCSEAQLNANSCPAESAVGSVNNTVVAHGTPGPPITASGTIFNVVPRAGEPARFGFVLIAPGSPPVIVQSGASLRPGDFGLDTTLNDLPREVSVLGIPTQIDITHIDFTLKGQAGSPPQGFLRNPTSCGPHPTGIDVTAYDGQTASAQTSFDTFNCGALPFTPEFSASLKQVAPIGQPVDVSTTISQTIEEAGLKRATVMLPADLGTETSLFLTTCSDSDFQAGTCPPETIVGSAVASSPLQSQPLSGPVALVSTGGAFPDLGLDLRGALGLKLKGSIGLDTTNPTAFRGAVTFDNLPDIPISEFTLTFDGGPGGLNSTSRSPCSKPPYGFNASFLAHSGATAAVATNAKASCGKKPKAKVKLKRKKSGGDVLKVKLKSGAARIKSAKVKTPKGVSFARGKKFAKGSKLKTDGKKLKVKATKRALKLKLKRRGARKLKGKFSKGAVRVKGKVRQPFKIVVTDVDGARTKLSVKAK